MTLAIRSEELAKRYRIGERQAAYGTLRDALTGLVSSVVHRARGRRSDVRQHEIWALNGVSFEVRSGEVLGIIGANGSGKTTLLKILSRVTRPTLGRASVHGRVGSLLEVGTGFHPELTGRENVYLNGAILGMKKSEIDRKFDEIVEFAEFAEFLDTPVKRYSSGMYMRLAFSVAAHLEPDILMVDEVLAVGDAAFQRKCLGQMGDAARQGRTILFVSHNMAAIQALCDRVVWLDRGRIVAEGRPSEIVGRYLHGSASGSTVQVWNDQDQAPGNHQVRFHRVSVRPAGGSPSDPITMRTPIVIEIAFWNLVDGAHLDPYLQLLTAQGIMIFESSPPPGSPWFGRPFPRGLFHAECRVPGDLLIAGQHRVTVSVNRDGQHILHEIPDAVVFEVADAPELRGSWFGEMGGVVRPLLEWSTELVEDQSGDRA